MSVFPKAADRLEALPPYIFSEIDKAKAEAKAKGLDILSLAIGDPDQPTPRGIVERMKQALDNTENHQYSSYNGTLALRQAISQWMESRFGVKGLDPEKEITALIGTKEGLYHFPVAFCNGGEKCLYPNPGYPAYVSAATLAGAVPIPFKLRAEDGYQPNMSSLENALKEHRPKYIIFNYPQNPTSALLSHERATDLVALAKKYETILVFDNAYSEIYFDNEHKPLSILEIEGAKDVAIEFHSFSKSYNMTGWRLGFAAGNETLVQKLLKVKTNADSGPLLSVQETAIHILENADTYSEPIRELYKERREAVLKGFQSLGIEYFPPESTFYIWAKVPNQMDSMAFAKGLIKQYGLIVTPGVGFGEQGTGFFRLALTVDVPRIKQALEHIRNFL